MTYVFSSSFALLDMTAIADPFAIMVFKPFFHIKHEKYFSTMTIKDKVIQENLTTLLNNIILEIIFPL